MRELHERHVRKKQAEKAEQHRLDLVEKTKFMTYNSLFIILFSHKIKLLFRIDTRRRAASTNIDFPWKSHFPITGDSPDTL